MGKLVLPQWQLDFFGWLRLCLAAFADGGGLSVERCDESWTAMFLVAVLLHTFGGPVLVGEWVAQFKHVRGGDHCCVVRALFRFGVRDVPARLPVRGIVALWCGYRNGGIDVCPLHATVSDHDFQHDARPA